MQCSNIVKLIINKIKIKLKLYLTKYNYLKKIIHNNLQIVEEKDYLNFVVYKAVI